MDWDKIIQYSLIALAVITAVIALVLAKLDIRDKRKKYLGFKPRDIKAYSAYISFIAAILLIFLQTKKEVNEATALQKRYREVDSVENKHFDSTLNTIDSTIKIQQTTLTSTDSILGRQTEELKNQRQTLEDNGRLLKGQDNTLSSIQEILHPLFPLEISGTCIVLIDSLDKNTVRKIDEFQNYLTNIDTSKLPRNFYLLNIENGIFWHDWFCLASDTSKDRKFNELNLKVTKAIIPMFSVTLYKNKKDSINLYTLPINWDEVHNFRTKWIINKTQRLIYIDFVVEQKRLSDLSSNSNTITSFYSCQEGFIQCKISRFLIETYSGAYLKHLLFGCGQDNMDSYPAVFHPQEYKLSGINKIYSLPVTTILKN